MGKFYEGLYEELSLFVRQSAWLNTTPERPKNAKAGTKRLTRLKQLRHDSRDEYFMPDMPPVERGGYLLGYFYEIGPVDYGGMSACPISHASIRAWQSNIGIELHPWEVRILRQLSLDYLAEMDEAESAERRSPWSAVSDAASSSERAAVAERMRTAVRALAQGHSP